MPDGSVRMFDSFPRATPARGSGDMRVEDVPMLDVEWEFFQTPDGWRARPRRQRG